MFQYAGNLLFVDALFGSDTRGQAHRSDLPFLTIAAALAEAQSGETVVVLPGTYDEYGLAKNGVNLYFHEGAEVVYTGAADVSLFSDAADGANGAVTCKILGFGKFMHSGSLADSTNPNATFRVSNASSVVHVEANEINNEVSTDTDENAILVSNGTATFIVRKTLASTNSPAVKHTGGTLSVLDNSTRVTRLKKIDITADFNNTEQLTGWKLPSKAIVTNVWVDVTTADATETLDVGTNSADSGDADGFLDGVSVNATGIQSASLVAGAVTRGALLKETVTGSGAATHSSPIPNATMGGKEISYTGSHATANTMRGSIYIEYVVLV